MTKYRVLLTRQIEQEARIYVDAKDAETAQDKAIELALNGEVSNSIWVETHTEPHTLSAEAEASDSVDRRL